MSDNRCCQSTEEVKPSSCCTEPWMSEQVHLNGHDIPVVSTQLTVKDRIGSWKARWGINRYHYTVDPGLYGVGNPNDASPVLVTANYKMTFDRLREALHGYDAFILVLDTRGINVWCAAGKGTFGTQELIQRIQTVELNKIISHRQVVLPQLGAPGVAAHQVVRATGFKAVFGPIRATDIPAYLDNHLTVTPKMREVTFPFWDRLVLTPMEIVPSLKYTPIYLMITFGFVALTQFQTWQLWIYFIISILGSIVFGAVLVPALLPWIPFRSFTTKGYVLGIVLLMILYSVFAVPYQVFIGNGLILLMFVAYLALNFTGSTTFTSLSGVEKELKMIFPIWVVQTGLGFVLLLMYPFVDLFGWLSRCA